MVALPDKPINLSDDPSTTTANVIGVIWDEGLENGGTAVLDYSISYDQSTGSWIELATGVVENSYSTIVTLIPGNTY